MTAPTLGPPPAVTSPAVREIVIALAVGAASFVVATLALSAVALWALRKRNRVHPSVASAAPLAWLAAPSPAARLHRRLRGTIGLVRTRRGWPTTLCPLIDGVADQAVLLDAELVVLSHVSRAERRRRLGELADRVTNLERTTLRLVALRDRSSAAAEARLDQLVERVSLLEQAHDDLDRAVQAPFDLPAPAAVPPLR